MTKTKDLTEKVTNFSAIVEVDLKGQNRELHSHLLDMVLLATEQDPHFKDELLEALID